MEAVMTSSLFLGVSATIAGIAVSLCIIGVIRSVFYGAGRETENTPDSEPPAESGKCATRRPVVRVGAFWINGWRPAVRWLAWLIGPSLPIGFRAQLQRRLRRAGLDDDLSPQQLVAASAFWCFSLALLGFALGQETHLFGLAGSVGLLLPFISLRDLERRQSLEVARELPSYVEMLTLALEAGGALSVAMRVATDRARDGALRRGFIRVQGDLRAGRTRAEALRGLAERFEEPAVTTLVAALIQADASGASLAAVLRAQTEQQLNERFNRAEKQALEAPVKMLGPLVLCVFPCTFLVLAFPVLMRFL